MWCPSFLSGDPPHSGLWSLWIVWCLSVVVLMSCISGIHFPGSICLIYIYVLYTHIMYVYIYILYLVLFDIIHIYMYIIFIYYIWYYIYTRTIGDPSCCSGIWDSNLWGLIWKGFIVFFGNCGFQAKGMVVVEVTRPGAPTTPDRI